MTNERFARVEVLQKGFMRAAEVWKGANLGDKNLARFAFYDAFKAVAIAQPSRSKKGHDDGSLSKLMKHRADKFCQIVEGRKAVIGQMNMHATAIARTQRDGIAGSLSFSQSTQ